ncbi:MAG: GTP-binding protein Era, partial [uncultured Solirubrobacteraceae bacterium]
GDPVGVRRGRRAPERRQVDAHQRARRAQGRDRLGQAADDAARDPRRRDDGRGPARARRPARRAAPARRADAADAVARRARGRRGRRRALRHQRHRGRRAGRPVDRVAAREDRRPGRHRAQQDRPALEDADRLRAHGGLDARGRRRDLPDRREDRRRRRAAARRAQGPAARGPVLLPGGVPERPAARDAARRAHPRGGAQAHLPGGPARRRGDGGGPRPRARGHGRRRREGLDRDGLPEGDPHRQGRQDDQDGRDRRPQGARARAGHAGPPRTASRRPAQLADRRADARPSRDRI